MPNTDTDNGSRYTDAMVARLREEAPLNLDKARALAAEFGFDETNGFRSVIAKATREDIEYVSKGNVSKTGEPVEKKSDIVAEISELVGETLSGLEKAPKGTLQRLRNSMVASVG